MRRGVLLWTITAAVAALAAPASAPAQSGQVKAGVASVDASWHVGASAGQYAGDCADGDPVDQCSFVHPHEGTFDPTAHSVRRGSSYGIQSRLSVRALVIEGPDGTRIALLKNDFYIPQDLVYRRAGQLMEEEGDCGITPESLTMAVTHNHSSPFISSTSWGVWAFQDVFDVRFYNYMAERMFEAVERACDDLRPVRVGASVSQFDKTQRHSFGPAIADDGTPAGYPESDTDHDLTVIRFDDVSDPGDPKPLANLVNFSLHPEFLEGNDLISADYIGPLERMVDRRTGATTVWTQGSVGTTEPERTVWHDVHERLEFSHRDYGQSEYGARLMANAIIDTWRDIERGSPEDPDRFIDFATEFPVEMKDAWYPGPFSHPYPGVSNCRTDKGLEGNPRLPVVGLPTCQELGFGVQDRLRELSDSLGLPDPIPNVPGTDPGLNTDDFQALGIPVPENYSAPSYAGLQEDIDVHLQGIRLGEIYLPVCSCEQWLDQSENIESRTDRVVGNEHLGFDWGEQCTDNGNGTWSCPNPHDPGNASARLTVTDHEYRRMRAQVNNPANGWNDAENAAEAESEPVDPAQIKGNYTHDDRCGPDALAPGDDPCGPGETSASAALGYTLTVPISMANDYNGYIATYREYQRGDHYRKSLTGWGPHSSDYMASRLVALGRLMRAPPEPAAEAKILPADQEQEEVLAAKAELDTAINDQRAAALGEVGAVVIDAYEAALPDDGGEAQAIDQPDDVERFGAAFFTWNGGSNFTDNPTVEVERKVEDGWRDYADQSGEVQVTLEFPEVGNIPGYLVGEETWEWTAHFEAFVSPFDPGERPEATPQGTYRFVVEGMRREGRQAVPYRLTSEEFEVEPWNGIAVEDLRLEPDRRISFRVGPRHTYEVRGGDLGVGGPDIEAEIGPIDYPDSYDSPARFIREQRRFRRDPAAPGDPSQLEWFCFTCSFRPWIDAGDAVRARVTITNTVTGATETVPASKQGDRWVTERRLRRPEQAVVEAGAVRDRYGNFNGGPAGPLSGGQLSASSTRR